VHRNALNNNKKATLADKLTYTDSRRVDLTTINQALQLNASGLTLKGPLISMSKVHMVTENQ